MEGNCVERIAVHSVLQGTAVSSASQCTTTGEGEGERERQRASYHGEEGNMNSGGDTRFNSGSSDLAYR